MSKIENGWYRSGDKLIEVRRGRVACMEEITTRGGGQTVFLDPREFDGDEEAIEKYGKELESATEQLTNPFTVLEFLGKSYKEAYAVLESESESDDQE